MEERKQKTPEEINVELRSEPLNEVLSKPPSWIIRSGNTMFFLLFVFLLIFSSFIWYSDEIVGEGVLCASDPPFEISNASDVQLKRILVRDGQTILKNQVLVTFEDAIVPEDILTAERSLNVIREYLNGKIDELSMTSAKLELGTFSYQWQLLSSRINRRKTDAQPDFEELCRLYAQWKTKAVLLAPCNGKVLFNGSLQCNRNYLSGQVTFLIAPSGKKYLVHSKVPLNDAGKIKRGQKVLIELLDYPKDEYGVLVGKVKSISQLAVNNQYDVEIELPNQLETSYHKQIPKRTVAKCNVRIITDEKRLLTRLLDKLAKL